MALFVTILPSGQLLTHDGNVQLGVYRMEIQDFLERTNGIYQLCYWLPDIASSRYKSLSYQKHLKAYNRES